MSEPSFPQEFSIAHRDDGDLMTAEHSADTRHLYVAAERVERDTTWAPQYNDGQIMAVADVDEVEQLSAAGSLHELRRLRSFSHEVRLLFYPAEQKFYAAIYLEDLLWRAMKSIDFDVAERAFEAFALQVNHRARSEVKRMQLDAANAQLMIVVAQSQAKAEQLRLNIERNAAQKMRAAERENELVGAIKQLEGARVQAQLQAGRIARLIGQLDSNCMAQLPRYRPGVVPFRSK